MYKLLSDKTFAISRLFLYAAFLSFFYGTSSTFIEGRSFCVFYNLFDVKCPGCGMTRAFYNAFHGDFLRAVEYNWFVILLFPAFIILMLEDSLTILKRIILRQDFNNPEKRNVSLIERFLLFVYVKSTKKPR